jgi:mannosyltransferase
MKSWLLHLNISKIADWLKCHRAILLLLLITAIGVFLRLYTIGKESIWFDEAASIYSAKRPIIDMIWDCVLWQRNPPLHFVTLKIWMNLFGDSEVAIRTLSAIFGIASLPLIYLVGKQLFNTRVGILASFFLSISAYAIYYSQESRAYAMLVFFTILSFIFFIRIVKYESTNKWYFIAYFVTNTLLVYTHYFGLFVVASQLFYFILVSKYQNINKRFFWYAQIATGIAFLPWAEEFLRKSVPNSVSWDSPTVTNLVSTLESYSGWGDVSNWLLVIFGCLCLMRLFSLKKRFSHSLREPTVKTFSISNVTISVKWDIILLLIWFVFPIILPFIISQLPFQFTGIYVTRYTISALPAFYLLAAKGIEIFLSSKLFYPIFAVVFVGIMWFSSLGLQTYYSEVKKEQWREAVRMGQPLFQNDDVILLNGWGFTLPFNYYYKGEIEEKIIDGNESQGMGEILASVKQRVWLYQGGWGTTTTRDYLMDRFGEQCLLLHEQLKGIEIYLFDLAKPDE